MIRTYSYNNKASKVFSRILRDAQKAQGISKAEILRQLNLRGIDISYAVLDKAFLGKRKTFYPLETFALINLLGLDAECVYNALLLSVNGGDRANQFIQVAVSKGKIKNAP